MPSCETRSRRSRSPLMIASACPVTASARNLSSSASREEPVAVPASSCHKASSTSAVRNEFQLSGSRYHSNLSRSRRNTSSSNVDSDNRTSMLRSRTASTNGRAVPAGEISAAIQTLLSMTNRSTFIRKQLVEFVLVYALGRSMLASAIATLDATGSNDLTGNLMESRRPLDCPLKIRPHLPEIRRVRVGRASPLPSRRPSEDVA